MIKKTFIILVAFVMITSVNMVAIFATNINDLQQQKNDINKQKEEKEAEKDQIEEEKSAVMSEIQELTAQITSYELEIEDLNNQIKDLEVQIAETEVKLVEAQEKVDHQNKMLQKRIVALYEAGETTFLDVLLNSRDITEFVTNYYIVAEIATIDAEMLQTLENSKKEIEEAKKLLDENKNKIEIAKNEKETKANAIKVIQAEKQSKVNALTAEEKALQQEIDQHVKDYKEIQKQIDEMLSSNPSDVISNPGTPSSYGYIFPVQGLGISSINNKNYPSYPEHTGTDININVRGKNVVAVKDGTVVISTALYGSIPTYDSSGNYLGSYRSYGEYILINHHDGTMTLYAHLYPNSRKVSKGDKVVQGQIIGTVGNTGNCRPRPTPSNPYNGTHLHFEVKLNGRSVNPLPYLI